MSEVQLLLLISQKNGADLEAIVEKIGLPTLIGLLPHILAIVTTVTSEGKVQ